MLTAERIADLQGDVNGLAMSNGRVLDASELFDAAREALAYKALCGRLADAVRFGRCMRCGGMGYSVSITAGPNGQRSHDDCPQCGGDGLSDTGRAALSTTASEAGKEWRALRAMETSRREMCAALSEIARRDGLLPLDPENIDAVVIREYERLKELCGRLAEAWASLKRDAEYYLSDDPDVDTLSGEDWAERIVCAAAAALSVPASAAAEEWRAMKSRVAELEALANSRLCGACYERHPVDTACPPYEVRTTGQAWFENCLAEKDAVIASLQGDIGQRGARVAELEARIERMRPVCELAALREGAGDAAMAGVWRCSCCGELHDDASDPAWRWNGNIWEHKCPGNSPQCGHQPARYFGPAKAAGEGKEESRGQ